MKLRFPGAFNFFVLAITTTVVVGYSNCGNPLSLTGVTNPSQPDPKEVGKKVELKVCFALASCQIGLPYSDCQTALSATSGIAEALGIAPNTYPTFADLMSAETNGLLSANPLAATSCLSSLDNLACGNPLLQAAYNGASAQPYSGVANLLTSFTSSCAVAFSPPPATFAMGQTLTTQSLASSITVGDHGGNGVINVVIADQSLNGFEYFMGSTTGVLTRVGNSSPAGGAVASGDFDQDGRPDVVFWDEGGWLRVWTGGPGQQVRVRSQTPLAFSVSPKPWSLQVGDFDGSGTLDVLEISGLDNGTNPTLVVRENGNGDGTLSDMGGPYTVSNPPLYTQIALGDLNQDGRTDFVGIGLSGGISYLGDATGVFASQINFALPVTYRPLALHDLNGDGQQDLIAGDQAGNSVRVLLGNGAGLFTTYGTYGATAPSSLKVVDLNADGDADLVVASSTGNVMQIMYGNGKGDFGAPTSYPVSNPVQFVVADFDKNGKPDIAVILGTNQVQLLNQ